MLASLIDCRNMNGSVAYHTPVHCALCEMNTARLDTKGGIWPPRVQRTGLLVKRDAPLSWNPFTTVRLGQPVDVSGFEVWQRTVLNAVDEVTIFVQ